MPRVRAIESWPEYFRSFVRSFDLTLALIEKLEAFARGDESQKSLETWARARWAEDGTQAGPIRTNWSATAILGNLYNADEREDGRPGEPALRKEDALEYLRDLRRGEVWSRPRWVGNVAGSITDWATRLQVSTLRDVIDGLGWQEFVKFASPGTGRCFVMRGELWECTERPSSFVTTEEGGTSEEVLRDLYETLSIDRADMTWLADEFAPVLVPEWCIWRQDDNGICAEIKSFTGYRKAQAALAALEMNQHKQTYWLEPRSIGG